VKHILREGNNHSRERRLVDPGLNSFWFFTKICSQR